MSGFKPKPLDENPFRPGYGEAPPELAGREREKEVIGMRLRGLLKHGSRQGFAIYGPRGMGKTALLDWITQECQKAADQSGRKLAVIESSAPEMLRSADALSDAIKTRRTLRPSAVGRMRSADALSGAPSKTQRFISAAHGIRRKAAAAAKAYIKAKAPTLIWRARPRKMLLRACETTPLVLLLDEAHATANLQPGLYQEFTNAAQAAAQSRPFLLVLAGTPDLPDALKQIESTFIRRAQSLGISLLDEAGAKQAIRKPLKDDGVVIDEDALSFAVEDGQRYPYFLQLWGRELWQTAMAQSKGHLTKADALAAQAAVALSKTEEYNARYDEIAENDLTRAAAEAVVNAFQDREAMNSDHMRAHVRKSLPPHLPESETAEQLKTLRHLGFVWVRPGESAVRPGIPSLMDYTRAQIKEANQLIEADPGPAAKKSPPPP